MTEDPNCKNKSSVFEQKLKEMQETDGEPSDVEKMIWDASDEELRKAQNVMQKACTFRKEDKKA
jgi:hypothetical protein